VTTNEDGLEARLAEGLAFEPSAAGLRRMDERFHAAARRLPRGRPRPGRLALAFALAASALVLVAATTTLLGLYESIPGDAYRLAWDRAQVVGVSETRDGYRVTLERAYADAGTIMLAVSVVDTEARGYSQVGAGPIDITSAAGEIPAAFGMGMPLDERAAANVWWFSPGTALPHGSLPVTVTVGSVSVRDDATPPPSDDGRWNPWHEVAGPWTFEFDLAVAGGVGLEPDVEPVTAGGITLALESIVVSPTTARATFSIDGASADQFALVGTIRHDGQVLADGGGVVAAGSLQLTAGTGADDPSGEWVITVTELVGMSERPAGPWTFRFSVP
jgi:hypothetical protein